MISIVLAFTTKTKNTDSGVVDVMRSEALDLPFFYDKGRIS